MKPDKNANRVAILETGYLLNIAERGIPLPYDYGVIGVPTFCYGELVRFSKENDYRANIAKKCLRALSKIEKYCPLVGEYIYRYDANYSISPRTIRVASLVKDYASKWDVTLFTSSVNLYDWCISHKIDVELLK